MDLCHIASFRTPGLNWDSAQMTKPILSTHLTDKTLAINIKLTILPKDGVTHGMQGAEVLVDLLEASWCRYVADKAGRGA